MAQPQMTGITAAADTVVYDSYAVPIYRVYEANGAIDVGDQVGVDISAAGASLVVAIDVDTNADEHLIAGVYTGLGGTNGETARLALDGKIAQDGDQIQVVISGVVKGWVDGTTDIAAGAPLTGHATVAGVMIGATTPAVGSWWPLIAFEAQATNAATATDVLVRVP